tara:strand:- start:209 stop:583 length:375 start_codon:yes stop_codon:yes gene_type:complete
MAFNSLTLNTYGLTVVTYTATGTNDIDETVVFDQDAEIFSVFGLKPAGGGTLSVKIDPDPNSIGNPSVTLGNVALGAADTMLHFQDPTPLKAQGRLQLLTTGAQSGAKGITLYVRVLPGRGRGL